MFSVEEARTRIVADLSPLGAVSVDLLAGRGQVAAEDVVALRAHPGFDNSAMDGYALLSADTASASPAAPARLRFTATVAAGASPRDQVSRGEAVRIFTGAPLPAGADAVVMQEDTERDGDLVLVHRRVELGEHVRRAGEDLRPGLPLIASGQVLGAGELALLAAQGRTQIRVVRRPRVAIVPTGNELVDLDAPLGPGQVPNSNSLMLAAQVEEAGGVALRMPPVKDDAEVLARSLKEACAAADLVLTSGGVSVGDLDLVRQVLGETGAIAFWQVNMKPGKPLAYGTLHGRPILGLPGNPVSSFVCFELFGRPAVRKLAGHAALTRPTANARLARELKRGKRREFLRAHRDERDGALWVWPAVRQGSSDLSSLLRVDMLIDLAPGDGLVDPGESVPVILLG